MDSTLFSDQTSPLVLDPSEARRFRTSHHVYFDNLGIFSFYLGTVSPKLSKAVRNLNSAWLQLHETSVSTGDREALEPALAGNSSNSLLTTKIFWICVRLDH